MQITGGMWFWAEWQRDFGIPEEDLWENLTWSLIPVAAAKRAARISFGHPLAYMVTSPSHHKDLAFLLITLASEVDLNTRHSLEAAKLAIRRSQTASHASWKASTWRNAKLVAAPDLYRCSSCCRTLCYGSRMRQSAA